MWKASAMSSRITMSSCAPRVRSTGMRTKSMRPDEGFAFCAACAAGVGSRAMKMPEHAVSAIESRIASWYVLTSTVPRIGPAMNERPTAMPSLPTAPARSASPPPVSAM